MGWAYWNPVRVAFGAGQFDKVGVQIAGRPYALVTYGIDHFRGLAAKLEASAGAPVVTIDNIDTNPDVVDLVESCRASARLQPSRKSSSRSAAAR